MIKKQFLASLMSLLFLYSLFGMVPVLPFITELSFLSFETVSLVHCYNCLVISTILHCYIFNLVLFKTDLLYLSRGVVSSA
jgi:hypothetical protein